MYENKSLLDWNAGNNIQFKYTNGNSEVNSKLKDKIEGFHLPATSLNSLVTT